MTPIPPKRISTRTERKNMCRASIMRLTLFSTARMHRTTLKHQGRSETPEDWAAYESRLVAVGRLIEGNYRSTAKRYLDDADGEIPKSLQQLEKDTFIQIIMGVKPITYFDTFVQEWYEQGGEELTEQIRRSNPGE